METNKSLRSFEEGLIWNYASIVILALSGILFDTLIICFFDANALGVFNQVYAYYIVISQICVWGIHMSIVRTIPLSKDKEEQRKVLSSAILLVMCISFLIFFVIKVLLSNLGSSDLITALDYVLPALFFFAVNKVILGFFNGLSYMKIYAVLQSLRNISIALGILFLSLKGVHYTEIPKCFLIGEFIVLAIGIILLFQFEMMSFKISLHMIKEHFIFGCKILLSNMVLELNTKVDIICLGWILKDDYQIGIYSFAVLFAEGFYQIFVVVRRSVNPIITKSYQNIAERQKKINQLCDDVGKYIRLKKWLMGILVLLAYGGVCLILDKKEYLNSIVSLSVLCFFIVLTAKRIIMGNFYAQIGKPEKESFLNICTVLSNFAGNIVLIYYMGINGAALATGISYVVFAALLSYMVKKEEHIMI